MLDVEAVLFDKDGTLLPFDPFWTTWTRSLGMQLPVMLSRHGVKLSGDRVIVGMLDWPANTRTSSHGASLDVATMDVLQQRIIQQLASRGIPIDVATMVVRDAVRHADETADTLALEPYPHAVGALYKLYDAGVKLGIVTGDNVARARKHADQLGLGSVVGAVVGGDCGLPGKPDAATLTEAVEVLGVDPARSIYVGDSLVDVRAAHAAGFAQAIVFCPNDALALPDWSHEADSILRDFATLADDVLHTTLPVAP